MEADKKTRMRMQISAFQRTCYGRTETIWYQEGVLWGLLVVGFHGVMVSTLDSESSDPSSNLGGTFPASFLFTFQSLNRVNQATFNFCTFNF